MTKKMIVPSPQSGQNSGLAWTVWALGCLFYFYEWLLQVSPGVMTAELMKDFNVTSQTLGILSGVYFCSYAFMQLPGGILIDYFGPKRLLIIATLLCSISTISFAMTESYLMACLARFTVGFGSAFALVGTLKFAANWFSPSRFALMTGLMVTIGMLGAIFGQAPLALLIKSYGWRHSMLLLGFIGCILAILLAIIASDAPKGTSIEHHEIHEPLFKSLFKTLRNKQLWVVAIFGGLMYLSTPVFCSLWGVPFLMLKMHCSKTIAANYISLILIGWAISCPFWGTFSNRIGKRKPPMYISAVGGFVTMMIILYVPILHPISLQLALLAFGIFSAAFIPIFAVAKEICHKHYVATGISFMNMMQMIGVALAQPFVGWILDRLRDVKIVDGIPIYSLHDYLIALALLPTALFLAILLLPFIRETNCESE